MTRPAPLEAWHRIAETRDAAGLDDLLADDVVFRSPAVHTPQEGRAITTAYLTAAMHVLGPQLRYLDEWHTGNDEGPDDGSGSAVLEFESIIGDKTVHGIDMLRWGADGRLTSFTVMARPFKGLEALIGAMAAELMKGLEAEQ
ncbi:nuclear transport factor 2 family protein [Nocardioides sp.]|uniref:nuclear transport factor 2 family protein n=1 Tax=Nocardioides sp. TaxID=35761 RepID=UPI002B268393|nr:nuclear transport factor 2 family protein [Nocardioides sp.]